MLSSDTYGSRPCGLGRGVWSIRDGVFNRGGIVRCGQDVTHADGRACTRESGARASASGWCD